MTVLTWPAPCFGRIDVGALVTRLRVQAYGQSLFAPSEARWGRAVLRGIVLCALGSIGPVGSSCALEPVDVHASRESADDCEPGDVRQRIRDEYAAINAPYEHFALVAVLRDFLTENVVDGTRIHTVYYVFQDSYNRAKQLPLGGGDGPYEPPAAFVQLAPDIATGLAWDGSTGRLSVPVVIWVREPFAVPTTAYRPHRFRLDVWENGSYQYAGADETTQFSGSVR